MSADEGLKHHSKVIAVREHVIQLLKSNNLTIDQVFGRGDLLQKKGTIRYRNPRNASQVWCGRGRPPLWVKNLQDLSICKEEIWSSNEVSQQEVSVMVRKGGRVERGV